MQPGGDAQYLVTSCMLSSCLLFLGVQDSIVQQETLLPALVYPPDIICGPHRIIDKAYDVAWHLPHHDASHITKQPGMLFGHTISAVDIHPIHIAMPSPAMSDNHTCVLSRIVSLGCDQLYGVSRRFLLSFLRPKMLELHLIASP